MMKVSMFRIWVILALLLLLVGGAFYWFFNNEVVITEKYPCYISAEEVPHRYGRSFAQSAPRSNCKTPRSVESVSPISYESAAT